MAEDKKGSLWYRLWDHRSVKEKKASAVIYSLRPVWDTCFLRDHLFIHSQ